jgi:hypothetical protein
VVSEIFDKELAKGFNLESPEPGRRLFRIDLGGGRSLILGAEVEVDPGGFKDIRREIPGDADVVLGLRYASALTREPALRGGQE